MSYCCYWNIHVFLPFLPNSLFMYLLNTYHILCIPCLFYCLLFQTCACVIRYTCRLKWLLLCAKKTSFKNGLWSPFYLYSWGIRGSSSLPWNFFRVLGKSWLNGGFYVFFDWIQWWRCVCPFCEEQAVPCPWNFYTWPLTTWLINNHMFVCMSVTHVR